MLFQSALPAPFLKDIVRVYWSASYFEEDRQTMPAHYPASVHHSLFFPLTRRYSIRRKNGDSTMVPPAFLVGHLTEEYFLDNANTSIFGMDLHHTALYRLWRLPVAEFTDTYTSLEDIFGQAGTDLIEQVVLAPDFQERIRIIEAFLARALLRSEQGTGTVDFGLSLIKRSAGTLPVEELAKSSHRSYRQFNRTFTRQVGLSPKMYANIVRFNYVLHELGRQEEVDWRQILHRYQYFDQAHFIKDFKRFTGQTPSVFLKNRLHLFSQHFVD